MKETSLRRSRISRAERGVPWRSIGLTATSRVSFDEHSRTNGVIVEFPVASIPIGFAVDLYGLKKRRETSGRKQCLCREFSISEHSASTVRTLVAVTNNQIGDFATRAKSTQSARISRNGLTP